MIKFHAHLQFTFCLYDIFVKLFYLIVFNTFYIVLYLIINVYNEHIIHKNDPELSSVS